MTFAKSEFETFIGHVVQKISTVRRANLEPALSNQYAHMCELEFEHSTIFLVKTSQNI